MAATVVVDAKAFSVARNRAVMARPLGASLLGRTSRAGKLSPGAASNLGDGLSLGVGLSRRNESHRQNAPRLSGGSCLASRSSPREAGSSTMASSLSDDSRRWSESRLGGAPHPSRVSHQAPGPVSVPRADRRTSPHGTATDRMSAVLMSVVRTSVVRTSVVRTSAARMSAVHTLSLARLCGLA
jgi:hypothetical protein